MREKVDIVGIDVDNVTMEESMEALKTFLEGGRLNMIFTPNSEIMIDAVKDRELGEILNEAQLLIPDGIGLVIASRFYKTPLKEKVAGVELGTKLIELAEKEGKSIFLFGGKPGVAEEAANKLKEKYGDLKIAGTMHGYFAEDEEEAMVDKINESGADILFAALGAPKQEKFIYRYKDSLKVKIAMGVGGGIDIWAGVAQRAPEFYQKAGLEWLYRFIKEPKRFMRILKLPKFIALAFVDAKTR